MTLILSSFCSWKIWVAILKKQKISILKKDSGLVHLLFLPPCILLIQRNIAHLQPNSIGFWGTTIFWHWSGKGRLLLFPIPHFHRNRSVQLPTYSNLNKAKADLTPPTRDICSLVGLYPWSASSIRFYLWRGEFENSLISAKYEWTLDFISKLYKQNFFHRTGHELTDLDQSDLGTIALIDIQNGKSPNNICAFSESFHARKSFRKASKQNMREAYQEAPENLEYFWWVLFQRLNLTWLKPQFVSVVVYLSMISLSTRWVNLIFLSSFFQ